MKCCPNSGIEFKNYHIRRCWWQFQIFKDFHSRTFINVTRLWNALHCCKLCWSYKVIRTFTVGM